MRTKNQILFQNEFGGIMFPRPLGMSDRNYEIAIAHLVSEKSLEDISWTYKLSRERIRQIVENGLRRAVEAHANPEQRPRFRAGLSVPSERTTTNDGRQLRSVSIIPGRPS